MAAKSDPTFALLKAEAATWRACDLTQGKAGHTSRHWEWFRAEAELFRQVPTTSAGAAKLLRFAARDMANDLGKGHAPLRVLYNVARFLERLEGRRDTPRRFGELSPDERRALFHARALKTWETRRAKYGPKGCEWPRRRPRHQLRLAAVDGHLIAPPPA